ncbi:MAG TPA: CoA transferase [Amycolatopsis sp.]|nr:CoA transferase [Amycolatopsis sp.]
MSAGNAVRGPLTGVRVVELASGIAGYAGKLMADLGADVVVVEPPGGHVVRGVGPFADGEPGPETSLWWWYYNTSKRGVVLDLEDDAGRAAFRRLAGTADIVVEGEAPGRLAGLGVDHTDVRTGAPQLIWVSITPFGRTTAQANEPATDLTLLAGGGAVWSCGYDDHSRPPVRGGGNQAYHIGSVFGAMAALTALLHRDAGGPGQHIDVNVNAAVNVSTEISTVAWLLAGDTVQRQTGRHAMPTPTSDVQVRSADGRYVTTGFAPHTAADYANLLDWLDQLGLRDGFPEAFFLQMGVDRGGLDPRDLEDDVEGTAIFAAGRDVLVFIAERIDAYDFFRGSQERDLQCGIIYAPDEALADVHTRARGFPADVWHEDLGRTVAYPGPPVRFLGAPGAVRRAPHIGEHDAEILDG